MLFGNKGIFHLPIAFLLVVLCLSGFFILTYFRYWTKIVETQLQLNQCVGQHAFRLRDTLIQIERMNNQIQHIRVMIAAASLKPELIAVLKKALTRLVFIQDGVLKKWEIFSLFSSCSIRLDSTPFLPKLNYIRPVEDIFGSMPLKWKNGKYQIPNFFIIQMSRGSCVSSARVERNLYGKRKNWEAYWNCPRLKFEGAWSNTY